MLKALHYSLMTKTAPTSASLLLYTLGPQAEIQPHWDPVDLIGLGLIDIFRTPKSFRVRFGIIANEPITMQKKKSLYLKPI